jgi:hypothetical protein
MRYRSLLAGTLTLGAVLATLGCKSRDTESIWAGRDPREDPDGQQPALEAGALHVLWFGHSLLRAPAGWPEATSPAMDIPRAVAELHALALADGRTERPMGRSIALAEGPFDLSYWLDGPGQAREALASRADTPFTHVVGVGFMHLIGDRWFEHPTLAHVLHRLSPKSYLSPKGQTEDVYRFAALTRELAPKAQWVNYVGPALANNPSVQPRIDARFECIRRASEAAGSAVLNVPVGAAFRRAEDAAGRDPSLGIRLQHADDLHLTPQGELLAACVFYESLFGVSSVGLPPPERMRGHLGAREDALVLRLETIAHELVSAPPRASCAGAELSEDDAGRRLLERGARPKVKAEAGDRGGAAPPR